MPETNVFALVLIVKAAWGNPADITGAVWSAGYRKAAPTTEEAVMLTIDRLGEYDCNGIPREHWPKNYQDILSHELNDVIFDSTWPDDASPSSVAKAILRAGYSKEVTSD